MIITLNDVPHELAEGTSLADFLDGLSTPATGIAIAIEGRVVPRADWSATRLVDGQKLILIHAVSGG